MKKALKLLSILFLITLAFCGCSNSDESDSKNLAEKFVKNLYTVNAKQVTEFNKILSLENKDASKINEILESLHKDIKPLMTEKEYENLIANRSYAMNLKSCAENNCTMQITSVTLTKTLYDSKEAKAGYNYEVKFKSISTKDKKEVLNVAKGYIGLSKENTEWKISSYLFFH